MVQGVVLNTFVKGEEGWDFESMFGYLGSQKSDSSGKITLVSKFYCILKKIVKNIFFIPKAGNQVQA